MSPRDLENARQKAMEKLIGQVLRRGLQAGGPECPGSDLLAAYYERSFGDAERLRWEGHFAACARCQQVLAALAASEAPAREAEAYAAATKVSPVRRWRLDWRWLAPVGAAAAALALWVAIRPALHEKPEIVTAPPRPAIASQAVEPESEEAAAEVSAARAGAPKAAIPRSKPTPQRLASADRVEVATGKAEAPVRGAERRTTPAFPAGQLGAVEKAKEAEQRAAVAKALSQAAAAPAKPAPMAPAASQTAEVYRAPGELAKKAEADQRAAAAPGVVAPPAGGAAVAQAPQPPSGMFALRTQPEEKQTVVGREMLRTALAREAIGILIHSSQPAVLWRVGRGGIIERSQDSGKTWQRQESQVAAELLAGSAPSETVCWVVGRGGNILRTTDGQHWQKVSSPAAVDFIAVEARDALHATVVSADQRRYVTSDGGQSWRKQ